MSDIGRKKNPSSVSRRWILFWHKSVTGQLVGTVTEITKFSHNFSTHLLTVLTNSVILHLEQNRGSRKNRKTCFCFGIKEQ